MKKRKFYEFYIKNFSQKIRKICFQEKKNLMNSWQLFVSFLALTFPQTNQILQE